MSFDTTSVSLLEGMACGLAPIVTDITGNRDWITNGENGFLFPPKNPVALVEKAILLLENEDLRMSFGKRCFLMVKRKESWDDCVSRMEDMYGALL